MEQFIPPASGAAVGHADDLLKALHVASVGVDEHRVELSTSFEESGLSLESEDGAIAEFVGCWKKGVEGWEEGLLLVTFGWVVVAAKGLFDEVLDVVAA